MNIIRRSSQSINNNIMNAGSGAAALPKKPLSAYNLFFQYHRIKILQSPTHPKEDKHKDKDKSINNDNDNTKSKSASFTSTTPSSSSSRRSSLPGLERIDPTSPLLTAPPDELRAYRKQSIKKILDTNPYRMAENEKRVHTKTHGKMTFLEMSKHMGKKWKESDEVTRSIFRELANEGKAKFQKSVCEEYKKVCTRYCDNAVSLVVEAGSTPTTSVPINMPTMSTTAPMMMIKTTPMTMSMATTTTTVPSCYGYEPPMANSPNPSLFNVQNRAAGYPASLIPTSPRHNIPQDSPRNSPATLPVAPAVPAMAASDSRSVSTADSRADPRVARMRLGLGELNAMLQNIDWNANHSKMMSNMSYNAPRNLQHNLSNNMLSHTMSHDVSNVANVSSSKIEKKEKIYSFVGKNEDINDEEFHRLLLQLDWSRLEY